MIGAVALSVAFAALAFAALPPARSAAALSRVRRARGRAAEGWRDALAQAPLMGRWRAIDADTLRFAGLGHLRASDLAAAKLAAALVAALASLLVLGAHPAVALVAYAAFVAPTLWVERRAAACLRERRRALLPALDRVVASAAAGATVEQAFLGADRVGALVPVFRETARRAGLGVSVFDACAEVASRERVDELRDLAEALARARRGGRPLIPVLLERREELRLARRAERLEAASKVDGALSLVLVLAYLPALLLLVVVPLFLGLLTALG